MYYPNMTWRACSQRGWWWPWQRRHPRVSAPTPPESIVSRRRDPPALPPLQSLNPQPSALGPQPDSSRPKGWNHPRTHLVIDIGRPPTPPRSIWWTEPTTHQRPNTVQMFTTIAAYVGIRIWHINTHFWTKKNLTGQYQYWKIEYAVRKDNMNFSILQSILCENKTTDWVANFWTNVFEKSVEVTWSQVKFEWLQKTIGVSRIQLWYERFKRRVVFYILHCCKNIVYLFYFSCRQLWYSLWNLSAQITVNIPSNRFTLSVILFTFNRFTFESGCIHSWKIVSFMRVANSHALLLQFWWWNDINRRDHNQSMTMTDD